MAANMSMGYSNSGVDFNRLEERALLNYIAHHNIPSVGPTSNKQALAAACARHFNSWQVDEAAILRTLTSSVTKGFVSREFGDASLFRKRSQIGDTGLSSDYDAVHMPLSPSGRTSIKVGEQVAVKSKNSNENGTWILATVLRYQPNLDRYDVCDADDPNRKFDVDAYYVLRLSQTLDGLNKSSAVLAVFPETTSFYRAKIAKAVKRGATEALIQFEDDEDESGKTPNRRIEAHLIMPEPENYNY